MDKQLILSMVINQSRRKLPQKATQYYEFTEAELMEFVSDIVKRCATIADMNRKEYELVAYAVSNLVLPHTGDLIRHHFGIDEPDII